MTAVGYANDDVAASLLVVPEVGKRWFVTDDPFNVSFTTQLDVGDRFSYPDGHASERETYRWNGSSWVFEQLVDAQPSVTDTVVQSVDLPWTNLTDLNANVTHWATHNAQARTILGRTGAELCSRLVLTGTVNSGTSWATIPSGYRPLFELKLDARSAGTGATGNTLTIGTDGTISFGATLNSGAELPLDGFVYRVVE